MEAGLTEDQKSKGKLQTVLVPKLTCCLKGLTIVLKDSPT